MFISYGYGKRWKTTQPIPCSSAPCAALATVSMSAPPNPPRFSEMLLTKARDRKSSPIAGSGPRQPEVAAPQSSLHNAPIETEFEQDRGCATYCRKRLDYSASKCEMIFPTLAAGWKRLTNASVRGSCEPMSLPFQALHRR